MHESKPLPVRSAENHFGRFPQKYTRQCRGSPKGAAETVLRSLTMVREATSFGGVHSLAERRARWGGDAISDGFIRFSVGCEAADDILADVRQALDRAR